VVQFLPDEPRAVRPVVRDGLMPRSAKILERASRYSTGSGAA